MRSAIAFFVFGIVLLILGMVLAFENRPQAYEANMTEINR